MDDVLLEKIREYRRMLKIDKPDLDLALLLKILGIMNESSQVKVAIEPVSETGEWVSDTPTFNVNGLKRLEDGRLVLRVSKEKSGMTAGDLLEKLEKELKHSSGEKMPVLFMKGDEAVQLNEAFSHSMNKEQWAGLPFDLVLGVQKRSVKPEEDKKAESEEQSPDSQ